jgi:chondroitin AC lyase
MKIIKNHGHVLNIKFWKKQFPFFSLLVVAFFIFMNSCNSPKANYPKELNQLHKNLIEYYLETPVDEKNITKLLAEMDENGAWTDIDYNNRIRGGWPVKEHLEKVLNLAVAYKKEGSAYYNKSQVSKKIHLSLDYWLKYDFLSPNWWDQHIGVPRLLAPTLFLIEDEITPDQLEAALPLLRRAEIKMTGQNKVWLSVNVLFRSLLLRDADSIAMASNSIQEELTVGTQEGIQPDWSYHQHGAQLQFGNYGLSYLDDMLRWYRILNNTPFAFEENKVAILRKYLLDGQQWINWKGKFDISACGRQIFPDEPANKTKRLENILDRMASIDLPNSEQYQQAKDYTTLIGNKHFWHSDFHVHRTKDYYFSVKMCSNRVLGAETVNEENIQGYHMGDGVAMFYQSNKEHENIYPYWDWKKLPGTTIIQDKDTLPYLTAWGYHIESDFVGGVSDGETGIAVLDYNRDGLTANKSWFMFDDKIVCLGSGISAKTEFPVATTVNQVFLEGQILVSQKGDLQSKRGLNPSDNPDWILHDNTGYLFPKGGQLQIQAKMLEGTWHNVVKRLRPIIITDEVFKLWFDHGANPRNESYEYLIIPNANQEKMTFLEENQPFNIVNTETLQSIESADKTISGAVFYTKGKADILGGIQVDFPCVIMAKKSGSEIKLSMAEPTQKLSKICVLLNGNYDGENAALQGNKTKIEVSLPQDTDAGKTTTIILKSL